MTEDEIINIMSLPMATSRVGYYREIHKLSIGTDFSGCLCGTGAQRLYQICKAYANMLINNRNKNNNNE